MNIAMNNGRHTAEKEGWWQRRSKWAKTGILTVALLAISGVALAIVLYIGGFNGTITGAVTNMSLDGVSNPPTNADCVLTADTANDKVDLDWQSVLGGETCTFGIGYTADAANTEDLVLQDYVTPEGVDAEFLDLMCGLPWAPGETKSAKARLTFDGSVSSVTLDPTLHGFEFVDAASFDSALCPPTAS